MCQWAGCYDGRGKEHYAENGLIENHTMCYVAVVIVGCCFIVSIYLFYERNFRHRYRWTSKFEELQKCEQEGDKKHLGLQEALSEQTFARNQRT